MVGIRYVRRRVTLVDRFVGALVSVLLLTALATPVVAQDDERLVAVPTPPGDGEVAFVIDVTDGDTIKVELENGVIERVRYIGIDTPETVHPDEPVEPWGPEASAANEFLVDGRWVLLERDVSDRDRFDRLLRYVWVETPDGPLLVNDALVALGLAEVRAYPPDTKYHEYLSDTEALAREAGAGMHAAVADDDETVEPTAVSP